MHVKQLSGAKQRRAVEVSGLRLQDPHCRILGMAVSTVDVTDQERTRDCGCILGRGGRRW
ncbi:hypothetical protein ACF1BE_34805 [Streptomyces sp. NPDC014991]|uniref:hypothetical protein n=1 Tax=Streptomyces sp. NPDC014991 TaxID=3364935 RepID=UPI0036FD44EC